MKKFLLLLLITSFSTNVLADKILKNGFLSGEWKIDKTFKVENPKNKIVLIYNHGSAENDKPSKNCQWKNNVRNFASLSGKEIKDKEILVYSFCTDNPGGDDWKIFWKSILTMMGYIMKKRQIAMGIETTGAPFTVSAILLRDSAKLGARLPRATPMTIQSPTHRLSHRSKPPNPWADDSFSCCAA